MWKTPSSSRRSLPNSNWRRSAAAFTLVELLVSMTILVLIVVLFAQVIAGTTASISGSNNGMSMDQAASVALDKIGNTMRNMVTSGGGTLVVFKNTTGVPIASDGFAMIANQRVRQRVVTGVRNTNVINSTNIRAGVFGYCIPNTSSGAATPTPMLNWGDGTVTFALPTGSPSYVQGQPFQALQSAMADVYSEVTNGTASTTPMLQFSPVDSTIFRMEMSFLLSDGTIVSGSGRKLTPLGSFSTAPNPVPLPRNKNFVTGEAFAAPQAAFDATQYPQYPLAFNSADSDAAPEKPGDVPGFLSADSHGRNVYVRAVIIGLASLDVNTMGRLSVTQINALTGAQVLLKSMDGLTPLDTWDISSTTNQGSVTNRTNLSPAGSSKFPLAVLQNIRFYQRYFYVN